MFSIHDEEKLKELLAENGHKPFRYGQIENAIYKNFITKFEDIDTIPKDLRQLLNDNCYYQSLKVEEQLESKDNQTTKILWETSA
jgi:23S rRNA (adenine-C8)-methyltransferase